MKYKFHLRNIETGESRVYEDDFDHESESGMFWQWFEGNFCCDCNRSLFLYDWDESKELLCNSEDNTIVLDKIVRENDITVWENFTNAHNHDIHHTDRTG
jgi:hypothetical protein